MKPKIPIARILSLLTYSTLPIELSSTVVNAEHRGLLSIMQRIYGEALDRALQDGLVHTYEPRFARTRGVRGRIDHTALALRRFCVVPPVDCNYAEYTADGEANRRLLAATLLLARHDAQSPSSLRLLNLAARMQEVSEHRYSERSLYALQVDRRFGRFRTALSLADVVLRHGSVELDGGSTRSLGMLFDMDRLFEDIVVEGVAHCMSRSGKWLRQPSNCYLDEQERVKIWPDAVLRAKDGRTLLVVDAKYKATATAKNEDLYQATAYGLALGAEHVALVYAMANPSGVQVRGGGPSISIHRLDLDCEPDELRIRLAALAAALLAPLAA